VLNPLGKKVTATASINEGLLKDTEISFNNG